MNSTFDSPETSVSGSADLATVGLERESAIPGSAQECSLQRKILIVEDEPELAALLEHFLRANNPITLHKDNSKGEHLSARPSTI